MNARPLLLALALACPLSPAVAQERRIDPAVGSVEAPVLIAIGVHVEPHGATPSELVAGARSGRRSRRGPSYHDAGFFERDVSRLGELADLVEAHRGRLVVQAQTPFTSVAVARGETILADLEERGHEIALHFHEDAHLGRGSEDLDVATWTGVLEEEIDWLHRAGARRIEYWSGGNLYPGLLEAAAAAGLGTMSDYKNPRVQRGDPRLLGVHPWRPAAGPAEGDLDGFATHDPDGPIIFLPGGAFASADFGARRRVQEAGGDGAFFDILTDGLERSLAAARPDRVNVFHITVHPGEFRGRPGTDEPYAVIARWLDQVVDPLVEAGKVRWETFSGMAAAYRRTEIASRSAGRARMTFAVNVHDWKNVESSADTLIDLIGLYEAHGVRGDFYLTAPMVHRYLEERPDVIARLKESGMTISYHVRPPHPLYTGFDDRLRGLDDEALRRTLMAYETTRLDLATGDRIEGQPGGYAFVRDVFGTDPVAVGCPSGDPRIRAAALSVYRELGARVAVWHHEEGTDLDDPFEERMGLLCRPSDFSVTRWSDGASGRVDFWWNHQSGQRADAYDPVAYLALRMALWEADRPPFVTALIHENNFYRRAATPWTDSFWTDRDKRQALDPPYDLDVPDASRPRTGADRARIRAAYESLVAHAAREMEVVTSADVVALAGE